MTELSAVKSVLEQELLLIVAEVLDVTMKIEPSVIWILLWRKCVQWLCSPGHLDPQTDAYVKINYKYSE